MRSNNMQTTPSGRRANLACGTTRRRGGYASQARYRPQRRSDRYRVDMATLMHLTSMWFAAAVAVMRVTFARLLLGPNVASWSWRTEWTVAAARAVMSVAARRPNDPVIATFGMRVRSPIPPTLRARVHVNRVKLGYLDADRYIRLNEAQDAGTLLYFHGGGYLFGNPGTHRHLIARLVHATGTAAYAPRYRLAPHHRYPAAVDDGVAAYRSLLDAGHPAATVIISGDSAGAGLGMATVHRARQMGLEMPGGLLLLSPYLDLGHTAYTIPLNAATDYLPLSELTKPNTWYASHDQLDDPEVSPLYADLTGFPRMLVLAGGSEMLLDDAVRLEANAVQAGVDMTLVVEPDMMHVWPAIVPWEPATARALDQCGAWVAAGHGTENNTKQNSPRPGQSEPGGPFLEHR